MFQITDSLGARDRVLLNVNINSFDIPGGLGVPELGGFSERSVVPIPNP
jgi:hypothetical protein